MSVVVPIGPDEQAGRPQAPWKRPKFLKKFKIKGES